MDSFNTLVFGMWTVLAQAVLYGLLLTVAVHLALRMLTPANASTRFAVWFVTLLVIAILPLAFIGTMIDLHHSQEEAPVAAAIRQTTSAPRAKLVVAQEPVAPAPPVRAAKEPFQARLTIPGHVAESCLALWAIGAFLMLVRLGVSFLRVRRLKAKAAPAPPEALKHLESWMFLTPTRRPVRLLMSSRARSPMAVGFRNPAILLPDSLLLQLTGDQLNHLGLHELAHMRRFDDYTNLVQRIIQALLFFHPAVFWICRKLEFEREVACDDQVLALTGAPKPYAQVLTTVLENAPWQRGPILASGAAFRKSQIVRRIELMLDRTRDSRPYISQFTLAVIAICLFGAVTEIVKMSPFITFDRAFGGSWNQSRWSVDGRTIEASYRGDIQFGDDDKSVLSISPGGFFSLRETGWTRRELNMRTGENDRLEVHYLVDGREQPLDSGGRTWMESTIGFLVRENGIHAEERALRILSRRGPAAVFDEIDQIQSGHTRQKYLSAVIRSAKLDAGDLRRAMSRIRRIDSDHEKANLLLEVPRYYKDSVLQAAYFEAVDSIQSDHDRGRVLSRTIEEAGDDAAAFQYIGDSIRKMNSDHDKAELLRLPAAQRAGSDPAASHALLRATASIQSSHDKSRVLTGLLQARAVTPDELTSILRVATDISADNEKAQVLSLAVARQDFEQPAAQAAFYAAADTVQSASDRSRALASFVDRDLSGGITDGLARSIERISSDHDKAGVLVKLAAKPATPAYVQAVRSIASDNDKSRVIHAMVERGNSAASAVELAATLHSDHDKSQLLTAIAVKHGGDPAVHDALRKAAEKIASDNEYRRVMSKL